MPTDYTFAPECAGCAGRKESACPIFIVPRREWRQPGGCRAKDCAFWQETWTCPECGQPRWFWDHFEGHAYCKHCFNVAAATERRGERS